MVAYDFSVFHFHALGHADETADGHHAIVLQHGLRNFFQRILLQQGVGVHAEEIGIAGNIDAHVERIALAAVFLVHQRQLHFGAGRFINGL